MIIQMKTCCCPPPTPTPTLPIGDQRAGCCCWEWDWCELGSGLRGSPRPKSSVGPLGASPSLRPWAETKVSTSSSIFYAQRSCFWPAAAYFSWDLQSSGGWRWWIWTGEMLCQHCVWKHNFFSSISTDLQRRKLMVNSLPPSAPPRLWSAPPSPPYPLQAHQLFASWKSDIFVSTQTSFCCQKSPVPRDEVVFCVFRAFFTAAPLVCVCTRGACHKDCIAPDRQCATP